MSIVDRKYFQLCVNVVSEGYQYADRSRDGVGMTQIDSHVLDIPIAANRAPILTMKKLNWRWVAHELIWMLSGADHIKYLQDNGVTIWDQDVQDFCNRRNFAATDYAGKVYGVQWRHWQNRVDQILTLIEGMKNEPMSRRHIVTAWNPSDKHEMCLPPCHWSFEVIMRPKPGEPGKYCFTLKWHQRSVDVFLGLPFDIALYGFLGKVLEAHTGATFDRLIGDLSNIHMYEPHKSAMSELLTRDTIMYDQPLFTLSQAPKDLVNLSINDFYVEDYKHQGYIKAPLITKSYESNSTNS